MLLDPSIQHTHRVASWPQAPKCIPSLLVCGEDTAIVEIWLFRVLLLVKAIGRGMPDIQGGSSNRLPLSVLYNAGHVGLMENCDAKGVNCQLRQKEKLRLGERNDSQ